MKRLAPVCALILIAGAIFSAQAQRPVAVAQRLPVLFSSATNEAELQKREKLLAPGVARRAANVASATRRPWLDANGWRVLRQPAGKFYYDVPSGKAALAAAEAFTYNADAVLKIDSAEGGEAAKMLAFLKELPTERWPTIADIGVVDDGSEEIGEVMNLLARRNLLFKPVKTASPQLPINIRLGTRQYPKSAAADPSEFAQQIRRQLTDDRRTLRLYGSEMTIGYLTGDAKRARLHLLNYGVREIEGLRVRVRGVYGKGLAQVYGVGKSELADFVVAGGATEFSLSTLGMYALIDLPAVSPR